jgi:hypothetical protein
MLNHNAGRLSRPALWFSAMSEKADRVVCGCDYAHPQTTGQPYLSIALEHDLINVGLVECGPGRPNLTVADLPTQA